jgi:hypothetical protein
LHGAPLTLLLELLLLLLLMQIMLESRCGQGSTTISSHVLHGLPVLLLLLLLLLCCCISSRCHRQRRYQLLLLLLLLGGVRPHRHGEGWDRLAAVQCYGVVGASLEGRQRQEG